MGIDAGALGKVQDAARGVLLFADVVEPSATTHDGVVVEIGEDGRWVPLDDSPAAGARAARASAAVKRPSRTGRENPFSTFGAASSARSPRRERRESRSGARCKPRWSVESASRVADLSRPTRALTRRPARRA